MEETREMELEPENDIKPKMTTTLTQSLIAKLSLLVKPTPLSFPPFDGPSAHPPITSALGFIHIAALDCLNNIFMAIVASGHRTGLEVWDIAWHALAVVGTTFGPGQELRRDFWNVAVGVLWGIGNVWKGNLVTYSLLSL